MQILALDIETAPHKVFAWGLWSQDIHIDNIVEPGYTLCWAAKWIGKKKVYFNSIHHYDKNKMLQEIYDLICKADAVVHYNGTKFDMPILNQEFQSIGLPPPDPYSEIDLLKTVRRRFRLPSNKLDYVARHLGIEGKTKHMGMQMWRDCMEGCPKAWDIMKRYNIQDVRLLETVHDELLPWITPYPNLGHFSDHDLVCPRCESTDIIKAGKETRTIVPYQRYRCKSCQGLMRGERLVLEKKPKTKPI